MESITNVRRHSAARACAVTIAADDGHLDLSVVDSGAPSDAWRPGIGLRSIRDRAEELGGSADAGPRDGGWVVHARLPLTEDDHASLTHGERLPPAGRGTASG
jgi:signal transduction histidine kinase